MRNGGDDIQIPVRHTLETDGVELAFGDKRVLQSVYIKAETGRVTGLVGRNGCGKSCLMRIMYGSLDTPCKSVRIDGKWVEYAYRHGVVYAPQHNFVPASRLLKNILKDYGLDFGRLVSFFPAMEKYYSMPAAVLSGGERRILEVYLILASRALFCLLDEPFSQLSPLHIGLVKTMIGEEKKSKGIVVSDHMYRDVCDVSDEMYVIAGGTTYLTKSPDDLRKYGYVK
jgi:ABC-type multidrug transport system ATPase subunit